MKPRKKQRIGAENDAGEGRKKDKGKKVKIQKIQKKEVTFEDVSSASDEEGVDMIIENEDDHEDDQEDEMPIDEASDSEQDEQDDFADVKSKSTPPILPLT